MLSDNEYEVMIQTLNTGGQVQINGFNDAVIFIFDHALISLPILSESKYKTAIERDFWGQTWMAPPMEGSPDELKFSLIKNVNPFIERGKFFIRFVLNESPRAMIEKGIKFEEAIEQILFLMDVPNGFDTIARIYKTESGVRVVANKTKIQSN